MSDRRFGIVSNLSGASQGIVVNSITFNDSTQTAQARDEKGHLIDIAVYDKEKEFSIDGLYISSGVTAGSFIKVDNKNYLITSAGRNETNNNFQTATLNARLYPEGGSFIPPEPIIPNPSLGFKVLNGVAGISLKKEGSPSDIVIQYRKNNDQWVTYNIGDNIILDEDDVIFLSGANDHFSTNNSSYYHFVLVGNLSAFGNVQSLVNFDTAGGYSYSQLFKNCSGLKSAPQLPDSRLTSSCYYQMFAGCTSLKTPPVLSATTLQIACYDGMFQNCTSLTAAPQLPAKTMAINCYQGMFKGCTSLKTAPQLPAKTLQGYCYAYMFSGCTSLKDAPILSATSLPVACYQGMFGGCSNLSSINVANTSWGTNSTTDWVQGVAAEGTFTKPAGLTPNTGVNYIPQGWNIVNK